MNYRAQEVKVGLMVIISLALLFFFLVIVSGLRVEKETVRYTTHLAYVGGLDVGSPVRLGGVRIGKIANITFPRREDQQVELALEVARAAPIKEDSKAYLTSIGLMGEFYVEIRPGSPGAALLEPGSEIPSIQTTTFSQMSAPLAELASSVQATVRHLNHLLSEENSNGAPALLQNINQMLQTNTSQVQHLLANLDTMTEEMRNLTAHLDHVLAQNEQQITTAVRDLDSTLVETRRLIVNLQEASGQLSSTMRENAASCRSIVANLERSTRNLEAFSRTVQDRPWSLIRKSSPKPREIPEK